MQFESAEIKYLQKNNQSQPPGKMQHRRCCVPPLPTYCKDRLKILLHFALLHFALLSGITFCVKSYYILRQKLLHFALLLHFASKVITFCVTITFCVSYYILWRNRETNDSLKCFRSVKYLIVLKLIEVTRKAKNGLRALGGTTLSLNKECSFK